MSELKKIIGGASKGGGDGGDSFTEAPDNLFSYSKINIIDLLCEGEIFGFAKPDPMKCIYLDAVPIRSDNEDDFDGPINFADVDVDLRYGTPNQSVLANAEVTKRSIGVGKRITHAIAEGISYNVIDPNISAIDIGIRVPRLSKQTIEKTVSIGDYFVNFSVYLNGVLYQTFKIEGKTNNGYVREYRIPLGTRVVDENGVLVKIVKEDSDSTSTLISNDIVWDYVNEIIASKLNYPYSVVSSIQVDSRSFSSLPQRAYHMKFLKILLPSNYNTTTREFVGDWDGSFSVPTWSNNPAWVLYDILTSKRYGLGEFLPIDNIDKWKLYEIGKYCDEMVPSGKSDGSLEPRFTCNVSLNRREDALKVINDLCTVFRGMPIWFSNVLTFSQDSPRDEIMLFTNSNVSEQGFSYSSSDISQRFSVALVYYNNKEDYFRQDVVSVEDPDAIKRIGYKEIEIPTFGCTSKSQAMRVGKWAVYSTFYQSEIVSFAAGSEALYLSSGEVIEILDNDRFIVRNSGRITHYNSETNEITLDIQVYLDPNKENKVHIGIPKGNLSITDIEESGQYKDLKTSQKESFSIQIDSEIPIYTSVIKLVELPKGVISDDNAIFLIESKSWDSNNYYYEDQDEFNRLLSEMRGNFNSYLKGVELYESKPKKYRVVSIKDNADGNFEISALEYNETKYKAVEEGLFIDENVIAQPPIGNNDYTVSNVRNLSVLKYKTEEKMNFKISWTHAFEFASLTDDVSYDVSITNYSVAHGSNPIVQKYNTKDNFFEILDSSNGVFKAIVRTRIISNGKLSSGQSVNFTYNSYFNGDNDWDSNDVNSNILVQNLKLDQSYPSESITNKSNPIFVWEISDSSFNVEFNRFVFLVYNTSGTKIKEDSIPLGTYKYSYDMASQTPYPVRDFSVKVGLVDNGGTTGAFSNIVAVSNPAPPNPDSLGFSISSSQPNQFSIKQDWINSNYLNDLSGQLNSDLAGTLVFYSTGTFTTGAITPSGTSNDPKVLSYNSSPINSNISFPVQPNKSYYIRFANYDTVGKVNLNYSNLFTADSFGINAGAPDVATSLTLSSNLMTGANGYKNLRLSGIWNASPNASSYAFSIRKSGEVDYKTDLTNKTFYYIDYVEPDTSYQAEVRAINNIGIVSAGVTAFHHTPVVNVAPEATSNVPIGGIMMIPNGIIPAYSNASFMLCNSQILNTGLYPQLFTVLGYTQGGAGSNFRLPSGQHNESFNYMIRTA